MDATNNLSDLSINVGKQFQNSDDVDLLVIDGRVSADQGNCQDPDEATLVLLEGHAEGHGIVDTGVCVDDELHSFALNRENVIVPKYPQCFSGNNH